jgi:hypothetical protein
VNRLLGMQKEQQGEFAEALEIYDGLLKKNPANLMVLKRQVVFYVLLLVHGFVVFNFFFYFFVCTGMCT